MNIKRILPMEANLVVKNIKDFIFQKEYAVPDSSGSARCFYLDAASYNNLGDQAIALAMEIFLHDIFGEKNVFVVNETDVIKLLKSLKRQIRQEDVIVLSGGGNMGDMYPRYEAIRRLIIKSFPNNKIVIFPQTIDYRKDFYGKRALRKSSKIYGKHKKLIVCAREQKSYEMMKSLYPRVLLVPDIVLYFYGKLNHSDKKTEDTVGICLRHDRESLLNNDQAQKLVELCKAAGWKVKKVSTIVNDSQCIENYEKRKSAVLGKIEEFRKCRLIITDRLHGMIFSILAETPCMAIDNSNKKVSGVYNIVKNDISNVRVLNENKINSMENITSFDWKDKESFDLDEMYAELVSEIKQRFY